MAASRKCAGRRLNIRRHLVSRIGVAALMVAVTLAVYPLPPCVPDSSLTEDAQTRHVEQCLGVRCRTWPSVSHVCGGTVLAAEDAVAASCLGGLDAASRAVPRRC